MVLVSRATGIAADAITIWGEAFYLGLWLLNLLSDGTSLAWLVDLTLTSIYGGRSEIVPGSLFRHVFATG